MLRLYQRTDCVFSWKVRIALAELGLEYQSIEVQLGEKNPDVLGYSPIGTVPVLVDGGLAIWESSVIIDYLDRKYATGSLIPVDPVVEARVRLFQAYSDKVVGSCIKDLIFEKRSKPEKEWDQQIIRSGVKKWESCLNRLEVEIGSNGFFGGEFSAADCALAARFGMAEAYGEAIDPIFVRLTAWYTRMSARKSWVLAYPKTFIRHDENVTQPMSCNL